MHSVCVCVCVCERMLDVVTVGDHSMCVQEFNKSAPVTADQLCVVTVTARVNKLFAQSGLLASALCHCIPQSVYIQMYTYMYAWGHVICKRKHGCILHMEHTHTHVHIYMYGCMHTKGTDMNKTAVSLKSVLMGKGSPLA